MKKLIIYSLGLVSILGLSLQSSAADLIVPPGGADGTYASLNAAITAASPNDRIIVTPQAGAYTENTITITKSLQILSATEGVYYSIDGNINITPASAAISVTIVGMKLFTGGIQSTIASPAGARSVINLLNDSLATGAVTLNHDNYNMTCASNYIEGGVTYRFGKLIGNVIRNYVAVNTDASVNNPTDTLQVIGNKITVYSSTNAGAFQWNSTSQFFNIQNNFITLTYPANNTNMGLYVTTSKNSLSGMNICSNNTVTKTPYAIYHAFYFTTHANSNTEVQNNLFVGALYQYSLYTGGGNFSVHYNYAPPAGYAGFTNDGTNVAVTNTTLNAEGLNTNVSSNTINGGNPDAAHDDINLTRNDAGAYGGSFTLNNFFPFSSSDWSRVIMVNTPRRVMVNGTINVNATGFDK